MNSPPKELGKIMFFWAHTALKLQQFVQRDKNRVNKKPFADKKCHGQRIHHLEPFAYKDTALFQKLIGTCKLRIRDRTFL